MIIEPNNISLLNVASIIGETIVINGVEYLDTRLSAICTSNNINKWAKYKPVINNFTDNRPTDWWKGKFQDCGLTINIYTNIGDMITACKEGLSIVYNKPTGWIDSPYRLGDFANYDTEAKPPIEAGILNDTYYKTFGYIRTAPMLTRVGEGSRWLSIEEVYGNLIDLNSMYYGVVVYPSLGTTNTNYMTTDDTFGNSSNLILDFNLGSTGLGQYGIIQFLTDKKKVTVTEAGTTAVFIPIPLGNSWIQNVTIMQSDNSFMITEASYNNGTVTVTIHIRNDASKILSVNSASLVCRYGDNLATDPLEIGEKRMSIDDFVVPAISSVNKTYTMTGVLPDFYTRYGWVQFYSSLGTVKSDLSYPKQ